jgi:hypothetical protein
MIRCGVQKKGFDLGHAKRIYRVIMNNDTTIANISSSFISSITYLLKKGYY